MSKEDIIKLAREAGYGEAMADLHAPALERFAALVAAYEREACAAICDSFQARDVGMQPAECAGAIRARGET